MGDIRRLKRKHGYQKEHQQLKQLLEAIKRLGVNAVGAAAGTLILNVDDYRGHLETTYKVKESGIREIHITWCPNLHMWRLLVWCGTDKKPALVRPLQQLSHATQHLDSWLIRLAEVRQKGPG